MSKGIIVVNMPVDCRDCAFRSLSDDCIVGRNVMEYRHNKSKPDWCPIKEAPIKLEELRSPHSMVDFQRKGFARGWNACINKILKEVADE